MVMVMMHDRHHWDVSWSLHQGHGCRWQILLGPTALPWALSSRRSLEVDGPVGTETRIGRWSLLAFEEAVEREMVADGLL